MKENPVEVINSCGLGWNGINLEGENIMELLMDINILCVKIIVDH
jgi:hypothetical protein